MTGRFTLTPRAQGDISDIWDHTEKRWGIDQAETYARQLAAHVAIVAGNPALGRACPEVRTGYYKFRSGSHVLFYRLMDDGIEIVRVLHGRMDYAQHF